MLCLPQETSDAFKKALKSGALDIPKLIKMTTEARRGAFADVVGDEYATFVNTQFEKKLLLKNQQAGLIDWIKTVGNLKPEVRTDLIARVNKMEKAFNPAEEKAFLNDVVDTTIGTNVTREEAQKIFELSKKVEEAKTYDGVNDLDALVTSFENLDQSKLTKAQRDVIADLRDKIDNEKFEKNLELERIAAEKQAVKDRAAEERQAVRDQKEAELVELRKKNLEIKEMQKEEARLKREIADEEARITARELKDQERFDRQQEIAAKSEGRKALRQATGESIKKLNAIFKKITGKRPTGIEEFSPDMQARLNDIVAKREAIANGEDRMIYGRAKVDLENYVQSLTEKSVGEQFREAPIRFLGGISKSLKSTLDNSVLGRQGLKTLLTNPILWSRNAAKTFTDIVDTFKGRAVMDEIRADIVSRENYETYKQMKLAVNTREEAHPSSLPERIKWLGKFAQASENAFAGFLHRMRADLADTYLQIYKNAGVELTEEELLSLGKLINSQTARGGLGKLEPVADTANMFFFSLRKLKADIDTLTLHAFDKGFTKTARKQAALNLMKIIGGIAAILTIAKAIDSKSVDFDPRSADFGKIKIGNTRFDVTGGMSSLATLASRLATGSSKSSVTGKINDLNSDAFGATSSTDVIGDFLANKESPLLALAHHLLNHKDQQGKPLTFGGELSNMFVPLPITNANELLKDPNAAPFFVGVIADALGIGTNTYGSTPKQLHYKQVDDLVKKNYLAKQNGEATKSASQIAKEIYGDGYDTSQENKIEKEMDFYRTFGDTNKWANKLREADQANDMIEILDDAKKDLGDSAFRKFYDKALGTIISPALDKKWEEYQSTGILPSTDTDMTAAGEDRKLIDIIVTTGRAFGTSPIETFKLMLQNQSIRRIDNGTIVINRNTDFFDRKVGKSGYSESVKKERDAGKDQILDHTIPVEGGGLEKGNNADNLVLLSKDEWKKNSPVENYLGEKLREKKITGRELREYIIRYKAGRGQNISPDYMKEFQKEYGGVPLTFEEIRQELDKR